MTLTQLKVFVLVARLRTVKAAAAALGVSEPAVSQALTALRQSLGDPLLVRDGNAMELTPAGRRVVGIASQMVNLAGEAETAVRQSLGAPELLRVVASSTIVTTVAPPVLDAFVARGDRVDVTLGSGSTDEMRALLTERLADVALGPRLAGDDDAGIEASPLLRYRIVFVGAQSHPLAAGPAVTIERLADERWLVDPSGTDPASDVGRLLRGLGVREEQVRVFASAHAAWAAAAVGEGIAPAVEHLVEREGNRIGVARLAVRHTPLDSMWYVNTLTGDRRSLTAGRLRRFLATPEAMQLMRRAGGGVPAHRFRPPVYVTIWS